MPRTPPASSSWATPVPTFTNVGAFSTSRTRYDALGGDKLLPSFVEAGSVDGKKYAFPYYFGSRYLFMRKDVWKEAGSSSRQPSRSSTRPSPGSPRRTRATSRTFSASSSVARTGATASPGSSPTAAGSPRRKHRQWVSTLSDANSLKGLQQLQEIYRSASKAPSDVKDQSPWLYINDTDQILDENRPTGKTWLMAVIIMAPGWAHWSIGDLVKKDGKDVREWNPKKFGTFVLPGGDGQPAPLVAGGSDMAISTQSQDPELSKELMKIIFSADYQHKLGGAGLGQQTPTMSPPSVTTSSRRRSSTRHPSPSSPRRRRLGGGRVLDGDGGVLRQDSERGTSRRSPKEYDAKITPMLNLQ